MLSQHQVEAAIERVRFTVEERPTCNICAAETFGGEYSCRHYRHAAAADEAAGAIISEVLRAADLAGASHFWQLTDEGLDEFRRLVSEGSGSYWPFALGTPGDAYIWAVFGPAPSATGARWLPAGARVLYPDSHARYCRRLRAQERRERSQHPHPTMPGVAQ